MKKKWNKFWYRIEEVDVWDTRFGANNPDTYYFRWDRLFLVVLVFLFLAYVLYTI